MDSVSFSKAFRQEMAQVTLAGEVFRRLEDRVMQLVELDFDVALLRDFERVPHGVGRFGEPGFHFLGRSQVELLFRIAHAPRVGEVRLGANANQAIMGMRVIPLDVMDVVCGHQFEAKFLRPLDELAIDPRLLRQSVVLELEIIVLRTQRLFEPINGLARLCGLVFEDPLGHFTGQAPGERDEPLAVG